MIQERDKIEVEKALKKLARSLNVEYKAGAILLVAESKRFEINFYPPARSGTVFNKVYIPAKFEIQTEIDIPHPSFKARINTPFDRFTESILGQHDFQSEDQQFDRQTHIEVSEAAWGTTFFMAPEVKISMSNIFKYGFHKVYTADNKLVLDCFVKTGKIPPADAIERAAKEVSVLLGLFPKQYVCPYTDDPADAIVFNYPIDELSKDLKTAHDELWYGEMDDKARLRAGTLLFGLLIVFALACWRLSTRLR